MKGKILISRQSKSTNPVFFLVAKQLKSRVLHNRTRSNLTFPRELNRTEQVVFAYQKTTPLRYVARFKTPHFKVSNFAGTSALPFIVTPDFCSQ